MQWNVETRAAETMNIQTCLRYIGYTVFMCTEQPTRTHRSGAGGAQTEK